MTANRREGEDRILTVPNVLTAIRLMCLPVFVALMAEPHRRGELAAACLLSGLGVTDGLDGYIARHFHQVSSLGKVADPLVDRALVLTAVISALVIGAIPVWLVALVLTREFLVLAGGGAGAGWGQTGRRELGGQGGHLRDDVCFAAVHSGARPLPVADGGRNCRVGGRRLGTGARVVRRLGVHSSSPGRPCRRP